MRMLRIEMASYAIPISGLSEKIFCRQGYETAAKKDPVYNALLLFDMDNLHDIKSEQYIAYKDHSKASVK